MAPDPYATAADAIKQIIDAEFADLGVSAIHDQIHESLGSDYRVVGISPVRDAPGLPRAVEGQLQIEVRFYDFWDKDIDPEQSVDPRIITGYADRLKRALQSQQVAVMNGGTPETWFFNWGWTEYPDDPTSNKTRFHMRIISFGDNTALVETR